MELRPLFRMETWMLFRAESASDGEGDDGDGAEGELRCECKKIEMRKEAELFNRVTYGVSLFTYLTGSIERRRIIGRRQ